MKLKIRGEIKVETKDQFKDKLNIDLKVITFLQLLLIMMGKGVSKSTTTPSQPLFKGENFAKR
jgi:hypothetical protein